MRVVDIFELLEDYPIILNTRNWINKQDETCKFIKAYKFEKNKSAQKNYEIKIPRV